MEELQDAIEDAQYMNAMQDDVPKPTKEWKHVSNEERETYINNALAKKPDAFDGEHVCSGSLGLYLFTKYVKQQGDVAMSDFIMEIANYRILPTHIRMDAAIVIKDDYLIAGSTGNPNPPKLPSLTRVIRQPRDGIPKEIPEWSTVMKPEETNNAVHLTGSHLETIVSFLNSQDLPGRRHAGDAPRDYFDVLDVTEDDFTLFRVLGRGGFGLVNGCKKCTT
eukprot:gene36502-47539_t